METTWRARPLPMGRLGIALITLLLTLALAATAIVIGSRLSRTSLGPDRGLNAAPVVIPEGPGALFAFTSWSSGETAGDLYVVRADGTDGRRITADALDDWSPAWSPDGGRIAFYSGDGDGVQLRVVGADGEPISLADAPGCWSPSTQAPAWSPDGRFIAYVADRDPTDDVCDSAFTDVYVVAADGTGTPHRLLPDDDARYSGSPAWDGDRIAFRANSGSEAVLLLARIADADRPWGIAADPLPGASGPDPVALGWPRWAPDGESLAVTLPHPGGGYGMASVVSLDGTDPTPLWAGPEPDVIVPDWSPDGSWLSMLVLTRQLSDYGVYHVVMAPRDGTAPIVLDTPDLSGNAGPAMISPDGTRLLVRAPRGAMPGDILVVGTDGEVQALLMARQWSSMDWQPVVNPANPATIAPEGLPAF